MNLHFFIFSVTDENLFWCWNLSQKTHGLEKVTPDETRIQDSTRDSNAGAVLHSLSGTGICLVLYAGLGKGDVTSGEKGQWVTREKRYFDT
ncbi:hypothetical protein TNCV_2733261 [Trichonephila clavipes]|nr:hypothetical protein TNCV_2733261 [Trichonephila clavipes]